MAYISMPLASSPILLVSLLASLLPSVCGLAQEPTHKTRPRLVELDYRAFLRQQQQPDHEAHHGGGLLQSQRDEPEDDSTEDSGPKDSDDEKKGSKKRFDDVAVPAPAPPKAAPPNPPANPFAPGCGNEQVCEGKGDKKVDDASCWDCFESYRIVYCEKLALNGPVWNEKCSLEQNVRDVYCAKFAETDPPELKENCFFKDSDYKNQFCEKSYKTGFVKRCAEDDEMGEGYCKEWGKQLEGYLMCKDFESYMDVFCDKKSNDTNFDPVCATNSLVGSMFCMGFVQEKDVRNECVQHQSYLMDFCDKKATDGVDSSTCATDNRTRVTYCNELAMKDPPIETDACWSVEEFPQVYCHENAYKNPKCLEVKGKTPDSEGKNGGGKKKGSLADDTGSGNVTGEESGVGRVVEKAQSGEPTLKKDSTWVQSTDLLSVNEGNTRAMDAHLPDGWRSGWDKKEARFFFFPVEGLGNTWRRVNGPSPTWEKPTEPWVASESAGIQPALIPANHAPFSDDTQKSVLVEDWAESAKPFGIRAGVKLWNSKHNQHKQRKRPLKPRGQPALWAAVEEGVQPGLRPPVFSRQGDGKLGFQGSEASP